VAADYRTRLGEHRSELAAVRQRGGELQARSAQLRLQYQAQATDELREATAQLREIEERLRPSRDHVLRQTVRAPVDGVVMALRVAAAGAVIAPREALLDVVPAREKLVIDAQIAPQDIEHVRVGGPAEVRLLGSEARLLPPLPARIAFAAADRSVDKDNGRAWFAVTVEVDAQALQRQQPALHLQPGMPAELYVTTAERTLLEYLLKPLNLFSQRALREP
jgi:membrane fusion protein, epimerase transport system